ncbi:hypothetical protein MNEG_0358 [Monoraphidium neglectum]|uniref:S-acyltransferase n=1 Tax=Monoraphidium neglectum TaxID=145388 RepID=A0A0D2LMT0_9CHLO|nr:hypothetical protein MNEG_0358 [Monoraphidium neglectum]KIZ07589.1 hypothetical protein MNEG_0358 [Monoraphidium neglectum]|eukprot:XP_013906608.1 hypothetical protein MNEG_0358 [Monoraphidium neglectum]
MLASAATLALIGSAARARGLKWDWAVAGVLSTFVYLYVVCVTCAILPWLSVSVPGMSNLAVLTVTTVLALWCFVACIFFDPGRVPAGWQPDAEDGPKLQEVKKKDGGLRFCQKCGVHKPPRTHHCSVCQRCVLRMDHHCPWTGNCVGHGNYRAFFLLLLYGVAALWHATGLLLAHAWHVLSAVSADRVLRTGPSGRVTEAGSAGLWVHLVLEGLAFCLAAPAAVALSSLLSFHVRMVLTNKTTIEWREGVTAQLVSAMPLAGAPRGAHPYDIGVCNNLREVLGESADEWCWPPVRPTPGGTSYPTVFDPGVRLPSYKR